MQVPKTCENFILLCKRNYYNNTSESESEWERERERERERDIVLIMLSFIDQIV